MCQSGTGASHSGGLVLAYAEHAVHDVFFAVRILDIAVDLAEGQGIVDVDDDKVHWHEESVRELEADVHAAVFVAYAPCARLAALALECDGRQGESFAFHPDEVLVVLVLIHGLVAREVEGEIFLFAVDIAPAHRGQPIVVRAVGVVALVVVDYADGVFVGEELLPVDGDIALRLEEVLFGIERFVGTEGNADVGGRREPFHGEVDLYPSEFAFRPAFRARLAVHQIVLDDVLALFDFELAIVVHQLRGDLSLFDGDDVVPA